MKTHNNSAIQGKASAPMVMSYRFAVFFMSAEPFDIRFQKVSGLSSKVDTEVFYEGGGNSTPYHLPNKISYGNLSLEKGRTIGSLTPALLSTMFASFTFRPIDVTVCALSEEYVPLGAWVLRSAYPVDWSVSELDANSNNVLIDKLELAYAGLKAL